MPDKDGISHTGWGEKAAIFSFTRAKFSPKDAEQCALPGGRFLPPVCQPIGLKMKQKFTTANHLFSCKFCEKAGGGGESKQKDRCLNGK